MDLAVVVFARELGKVAAFAEIESFASQEFMINANVISVRYVSSRCLRRFHDSDYL